MQPVQKISCKCRSPGLIAFCVAALLLCFSPAQAAAPLARPILRDEQPSSGSSTGTTAQPEARAARNVHSPFNSEASVQVAARQKLFDFAVQEGLEILNLVIQKVQIPDYNTTLDFPVIGGVDVSITGINISQLVVPPELTKVAIESGYYHLQASNLTTQITFNWTWTKGPLSGSGYGDLAFHNGALDEIFLVRNQEAGAPQLVTVSNSISFESMELTIHSYSVDWLYQALLYIFKGVIKSQIEGALDNALHTDVPNAINGLLDTLPGKVDIQGLPFQAVFTYALYTLNYVMLKGYGEVDGPEPGPAPSLAAAVAGLSAVLPGQLQQFTGSACPFPATPLTWSPAEIGGDPHMFSVYLHQSIPNCILWGMFRAGLLQTSVQDGGIPQLRLITDLFGGLIPDLPKLYPKKGMLLDLKITEPPLVEFSATEGVTISARYDTNVSVMNATEDGATLLVAQLTANLTLNAEFGWDATIIKGTNVSYAVIASEHNVSVAGWNMIIAWVIKQAGPKQSLHQIWDQYVKTPATPYLGLGDTNTSWGDQWFVLNSDVVVKQQPPVMLAGGKQLPGQQQQQQQRQGVTVQGTSPGAGVAASK